MSAVVQCVSAIFDLRYRLAPCCSILPFADRLGLELGSSPDLLAKLPHFWKEVESRMGSFIAVVEGRRGDGDPEILAFGASAFLSDDMASRLTGGERPFAVAEMAKEVIVGGNGVLDLAAIRKAQAEDGLNLILFHAQYLDVSSDMVQAGMVYEALARSCFDHHRGYRIKDCFIEAFSEDSLRHHLGSGFSIRTKNGSDVDSPTSSQPFLLGCSREDAKLNPGARAGALFVDYPPKLCLRRTHREVLSAALEGEMDHDVADRLGITVSAVRRRWESIYEKVERLAPALARTGRDCLGPAVRGPERRRYLLRYLKDHPEELRPLQD